MGGTDDRKIVKLAEDETGRNVASKECEVLEGGGKCVKLSNSGRGSEDGGGVHEVAAEPGEALGGPYGRMLGNVFVSSGHVGFDEGGVGTSVPEAVTEPTGRGHGGTGKSQLVEAVIIGQASGSREIKDKADFVMLRNC